MCGGGARQKTEMSDYHSQCVTLESPLSLWTPRCWSESLCSLAIGFLIGDEDDVRLAGVARVCSPLRTQAMCYQTPLQTTTPSANAMPNLAQFMRDAFSQCRLTLV